MDSSVARERRNLVSARVTSHFKRSLQSGELEDKWAAGYESVRSYIKEISASERSRRCPMRRECITEGDRPAKWSGGRRFFWVKIQKPS